MFPIEIVSMVVSIFDSSNNTFSPDINFVEFKYTTSNLFGSPSAFVEITLAIQFEPSADIFSPTTAFSDTPAEALNFIISKVGVVPSTDS